MAKGKEEDKPAKGESTEDEPQEEEKPKGVWGTPMGNSSSDY